MLPASTLFHYAADANFSLGSVNTALTPQERFEEFMQTRGKRSRVRDRSLLIM